MLDTKQLQTAAKMIKTSRHVTAYTGAGISVESGIPPFRGENGLWAKYDVSLFDISHFRKHTEKTWRLLKDVFYEFFGKAKPNAAHTGLAKLEQAGYVKAVITQNIDYLHQDAGSTYVIEFHGTSRFVICLSCAKRYPFDSSILKHIPPTCTECGGMLKPDFVFFGEGIPQQAMEASLQEVMRADIFLVIGTTGEVYPAAMMPIEAKRRGAKIIEINTQPSAFTHQITDVFLNGPAAETVTHLVKAVLA